MSEPKSNSDAEGRHHPRLVVPLTIWLQWDGDELPEPDDSREVFEGDVTWCRDKIFAGDVEYVHADEIRRALLGHRRSELWGDNGLIAATMRCVEAVDKLESLYAQLDPRGFLAKKIAAILGHNDLGMATGGKDADSDKAR